MILTVLVLLSASPTAAQDRDPGTRQRLLDLAYVLGESHALRQVCDPDDQYWRSRMERLMDLEQPDLVFRNELADRFNTGFAVREGQFPECSDAARSAAAAAARRGRRLTVDLVRIQ